MAIDLLREQPMLVARAGGYAGKLLGRDDALSSATIHRWIRKGKYGVFLESVKTPCGQVVTVEALVRFFAAITQVAKGKATKFRPKARRTSADSRVQSALASLEGDQ